MANNGLIFVIQLHRDENSFNSNSTEIRSLNSEVARFSLPIDWSFHFDPTISPENYSIFHNKTLSLSLSHFIQFDYNPLTCVYSFCK